MAGATRRLSKCVALFRLPRPMSAIGQQFGEIVADDRLAIGGQ